MASAALHAQAVPAPMEVTAHESATIWTQGYGVGNGRLGGITLAVVRMTIGVTVTWIKVPVSLISPRMISRVCPY